jgi:hypothetical protein
MRPSGPLLRWQGIARSLQVILKYYIHLQSSDRKVFCSGYGNRFVNLPLWVYITANLQDGWPRFARHDVSSVAVTLIRRCEFSKSVQTPHTDLEQQATMPSLRAKRGNP